MGHRHGKPETTDAFATEEKAMRALLKLKGYDEAFELTKHEQKRYMRMDKKFWKECREFNQRDEMGHTPKEESITLGRCHHKVTFSPEQVTALGRTSYVERSEIYARAEKGIPTSVAQINEMRTLVENARSQQADVGIPFKERAAPEQQISH